MVEDRHVEVWGHLRVVCVRHRGTRAQLCRDRKLPVSQESCPKGPHLLSHTCLGGGSQAAQSKRRGAEPEKVHSLSWLGAGLRTL